MLRAPDFDELDDADVADAGAVEQRGKYHTYRTFDARHQRLVAALRPHVVDEPEAQLWFAVLEQALVDEFVICGRDMDSEDLRWRTAGIDQRFLRSQRCRDIVESIGLSWPWFRELVTAYARRRDAVSVANLPRPFG